MSRSTLFTAFLAGFGLTLTLGSFLVDDAIAAIELQRVETFPQTGRDVDPQLMKTLELLATPDATVEVPESDIEITDCNVDGIDGAICLYWPEDDVKLVIHQRFIL